MTSLSMGARRQVHRALDSRSEGLGFSFQCSVFHTISQSTQQKWVPGAQMQGWIDSCRLDFHPLCQGPGARGKVKSVEHALSWSLGSKQLPLPLPLGNKYSYGVTHMLECSAMCELSYTIIIQS